jgi:DNA-binding LacI/PurR family transcriptional regulator
MGRIAMRMLIDLLNGKPVTNVMVPGELIVRQSTRALVTKQTNPSLAPFALSG